MSFRPTLAQQRKCANCSETAVDGELVVVYDVKREEKAGELEVGGRGSTRTCFLLNRPTGHGQLPAAEAGDRAAESGPSTACSRQEHGTRRLTAPHVLTAERHFQDASCEEQQETTKRAFPKMSQGPSQLDSKQSAEVGGLGLRTVQACRQTRPGASGPPGAPPAVPEACPPPRRVLAECPLHVPCMSPELTKETSEGAPRPVVLSRDSAGGVHGGTP